MIKKQANMNASKYKCISNYALAVLLLVPNVSFCQEFIKATKVQCDTTLVREVSENQWLACSYDGMNSVFTMVGTSTYAPTLALPNYYYISDFEIYNDTVYFCGWIDSSFGVALFGYFSLLTFQPSTVFCCHISVLNRLYKLAVFNNEGKPHVVFTGDKYKNRPVLADAISPSPDLWYFNYLYNAEIDFLIYDDVAVTDNFIIATSRIFDLDSGIIHYFDKPLSYTTIFYPHYVTYRSVQYKTYSPILVTACTEDYFATLCKDGVASFVMSKYQWLNDDYSLESSLNYGNCRDINYNADSNSVEVLVYEKNIKYGGSLALHYSPLSYSFPSIPAHVYYYHSLHSIDYLNNNPKCFISSGINMGLLHLYKYEYDSWSLCPKEYTIDVKRIDNHGEYYSRINSPELIIKEAIPIDCLNEVTTIDIKCNY